MCVAFLSSVLFSSASYSESHVMRNKLGSFDFKELESRLYKVEISTRPIAAAAMVKEDQELVERTEDSEIESSTLLNEDKAEFDDGVRPQVSTV